MWRAWCLGLSILWFSVGWVNGIQAQDTSSELLSRINGLRGSLGLNPYALNSALTAAAYNQAQWMATTGEVSHIQPDGSRPRDRALAAGYSSAWVGENIYLGMNASVDTAWDFWVNSPVHYAGLTSRNYTEVGIAMATGQSKAYVLVFGAAGAAAPYTPPNTGSGTSGNSGTNSTSGSAGGNAAPPPSFVMGLDQVGNIMHQVQEDETLGDIVILYGYSWEVIPTVLAINNMSEADIRLLKVGSMLLIPPYDGTYTPTPAPPTLTPLPTVTPLLPTATMPPTTTPTLPVLPLPATYVAELATAEPLLVRTLPPPDAATLPEPVPTVTPASDSRTLILVAALVIQGGILLGAALEFVRRRQ
jgi:hypothetical protein